MSKSYSRLYFEELLNENKKFIKGKILNVGGGDKTYRQFSDEMVSIDLFEKNPLGNALDFDVQVNAEKNFPFKPNSFDSVLCTFFLQYAKNPQKVLENIFKVLKPGGHIIISAPFLECLHPDPVDYWRFSADGLKLLVGKKFKIIKLQPIGGRYLWFLNFLQMHRVPNFFTRTMYPLVKHLTKKEKHKEKWAPHFFLVAKKK